MAVDGGSTGPCAGGCAAPLSCDSVSDTCTCYGQLCPSNQPCSEAVGGCSETPKVCSPTQITFSGPRDYAIGNNPVRFPIGFLDAIGNGCGVQPYSISSSGELPPGMTLALQNLEGRPTEAGVGHYYRFKVRIMDSTGSFDETSFSVNIVPNPCLDGGC
jgi:hypothetical protein